MEKLKTQEAAFPTFPQGPLQENETETTTKSRTRRTKEALSRAHHSQPDLTVHYNADGGGIFS